MTVTPEVAAGRDLLVAALARIETHPETWDQTQWWCGTSGCLAGHMAHMDETVSSFWGRFTHKPVFDGRQMHYVDYVRARVGIEVGDAFNLTHPDNSLDDLRVGVKAVLNDEPVGPAIERARAERT